MTKKAIPGLSTQSQCSHSCPCIYSVLCAERTAKENLIGFLHKHYDFIYCLASYFGKDSSATACTSPALAMLYSHFYFKEETPPPP